MGRGNAAERSAQSGAAGGGSSGSVFSNGVDTIAALSALSDAALSNGTIVGVDSVGAGWQLDKSSAQAQDITTGGMTIAATLSGTGRWHRLTETSSTHWTDQATWFLSDSGNNENSGLTSLLPLMDVDELDRRLAGRPLNQAVVITILTALPATNSLGGPVVGRLRITSGPLGTVLIKGTVTTFFASGAGGFTAHTNINRATNTANNVTDAAIAPATFTAASFMEKRMKTRPAVGSPVQAWVAKDTAAKSGRTSGWITPETAFPYTLYYAVANVANGDPYDVQTLTEVATLDLICTLNRPVAYAFPTVVLQDCRFGRAIVKNDDGDTNQVAVIGCDFVTATLSGGVSAWGCRFEVFNAISGPVLGAGLCVNSCYFDLKATTGATLAGSSDLILDGETLLQSSAAGGNVQWSGNLVVGTAGVFDTPGVGIIVTGGGVLTTNTTNFATEGLYGAGNGTYGIRVTSGAIVVYTTSKPTLTGTTNDTFIGGVATAYAGIPVVVAAELAAILVQT